MENRIHKEGSPLYPFLDELEDTYERWWEDVSTPYLVAEEDQSRLRAFFSVYRRVLQTAMEDPLIPSYRNLTALQFTA